MDTACMEINLNIDMLMRIVLIKSVHFLNVKEDTQEVAIFLENTRDVNLQPSADINMKICILKMKE